MIWFVMLAGAFMRSGLRSNDGFEPALVHVKYKSLESRRFV
jgi:hypothetical protein